MSTFSPVIDIRHCSVRLGPGYALKNATWQLQSGQHWAFLGRNGAGKTTLMRLARGEVHPAQGEPFGHRGERRWNFGSGETASALDARAHVALVTADDHDAYLRDERDMTVEDVVASGIFDTVFLFHEPSDDQRRAARAALSALGAERLAGRSILTLSRGEGRLAVIARALVRQPRVLLLDEALEGLDTAARARMATALARVAAGGTQIVVTTHHTAELGDFLTHAAVVEDGRIKISGTVDEVLRARSTQTDAASAVRVEDQAAPSKDAAPEYFVRLENVSVVREGKSILSAIDWTLRPGEHWAVTGGNGAGKSTLAGLVTGAVRPSSGHAAWFGETGDFNVWDIRRRIGLVSPELQAQHRYDVTALDVVVSGNFSSIGVYREPTPQQIDRARNLVARVGLGGYENRTIRTLSYGQLRRLLIARALAPGPELLLLDEPCTGLDPEARAQFLDAVDALAASGLTVVFITHHPDEIPPRVTGRLHLENGRVINRSEPHRA